MLKNIKQGFRNLYSVFRHPIENYRKALDYRELVGKKEELGEDIEGLFNEKQSLEERVSEAEEIIKGYETENLLLSSQYTRLFRDYERLFQINQNLEKENKGKNKLIAHLKKRLTRDREINPFKTLLKMPGIKKLPVMIVHNKGLVYAQSSESRRRYGSFENRNLSNYIDCSKPEKQFAMIGKKDYTFICLPLLDDLDYSLVYIRETGFFQRTSKKLDEEIEKAMKRAILMCRKAELEIDKRKLNTI